MFVLDSSMKNCQVKSSRQLKRVQMKALWWSLFIFYLFSTGYLQQCQQTMESTTLALRMHLCHTPGLALCVGCFGGVKQIHAYLWLGKCKCAFFFADVFMTGWEEPTLCSWLSQAIALWNRQKCIVASTVNSKPFFFGWASVSREFLYCFNGSVLNPHM